MNEEKETNNTACDECISNDAGTCHDQRSERIGQDVSTEEHSCIYFKGLK